MSSSSSYYFDSDVIISRLTCPVCENRYQEPLNLPCSHNVCKNCLNSMISESTSRIECPVCGQLHPVNGPVDGSNKNSKVFPLNDLINELLSLEPVRVSRGIEFEHLLDTTADLLREINKQIGTLNSQLTQSERNIKNVCGSFRELINKSANEKLAELKKNRELLLSQVNELENKCLQNFEKNIHKQMRDFLDTKMFDLDGHETKLAVSNVSESDVRDIHYEASRLLQRLRRENAEYEANLFCKEKWTCVEGESLKPEHICRLNVEKIDTREEGSFHRLIILTVFTSKFFSISF